ncbi:putative baseplate assembly protein [Streptomyces sp. NA04227]|uniref:putative baseplate assembly protein n=1 Tax=Streptomyces sp. NA04227 TaxID=2742136 RepID=UPI001592771E|nr:putative baseplate assembly protein [Streptomyces sp. NA04227]QKW08708.1 putative baseplate assembly protein [Streptomyces sp. NA04227]
MNATDGSCGCGCGGHDERLAPAPVHNPPGRTALDYRVGEYGDFLAALRDRLASPAHPALRNLTVRTPDDPALGLLDATAVLGDLLTFHSERIADEGYLRTANDHRSLVLLGRLVGHRPRPGVAAGTYLAYTLDRDPRAEDLPVVIPRGARSHSVPASSEEDTQTFETSEDLTARWDWNELQVRRHRPMLLTPRLAQKRSEIFVEGIDNALSTGDQLLFVFGEQAGATRGVLPLARVRIDREEDVTALAVEGQPLPELSELITEAGRWIAKPEQPGAPGEEPPTEGVPNPRPVSRIIEDFDEHVLKSLRADLPTVRTPESFQARLVDPLARLGEAQVLARAYEDVAAWFEELEAVLAELGDRAGLLAPSRPEPPEGGGEPDEPAPVPADPKLRTRPVSAADRNATALRALAEVLPALRGSDAPARHPAASARPGSDLAARLLSVLDPRLAGGLHPAWRRAAVPGPPEALRELQVMRVRAAPFGATAPLKPVQDDRGRVIRNADWPTTGATLTTMRVVYDPAGKIPRKAQFQWAEGNESEQHSANLPEQGSFELGPGNVEFSTRTAQDRDLHWLSRRPTDSQEPGVTARLSGGLPQRTLFISRPDDEGRVQVAVHNGDPWEDRLEPNSQRHFPHGDFDITVRYTVGTEPANVEISIATKAAPSDLRVLPLDSVHEGIQPGSWVAIKRPRKGKPGPDGIPGDPKLANVTTKVVAARTATYANYGITGRGTELLLAEPWLDEQDVLLSHIRDTVVYADGDPLRLADEPLGEDVHGNEIELAELYEGLRPGRTLVVSGERSDVPGTSGVRATEIVVIEDVAQGADPNLPGDHVHTTLTLTADLAHRYRRETVKILGNVVAATHGESRDEAIGSGDAGRVNQTFALWQSPLTWLPAGNPLGAVPTLEVRVDGLLWHEVDSLAGRGPRERVYITGSTGDGRTTVTFGDGVHGARLPTGQENVRARYRFGTGRAANVKAGRITQAITRPLGVTSVTNPRPATGGADADGPALTRRTVPLAVSALDRLVSTRDYEDFARSRAGIGRALASELFDGRRRLLHVTVAGTDDVPLDGDGRVLPALRSALAEYGDPRLQVRVDVRELVVLLLAAKVKVAPDHSWEVVEPRLRQALLARLGYQGRGLGQPARLSEVLAAAHTVPGVDYVDVDAFTGIPASVTAAELAALLDSLGEPREVVPARGAEFAERRYTVTDPDGETLSSVAAAHGLPLAELLRLNPDITDTRRLAPGRSLFVFRGIRPAQLALLTPRIADTLILSEVTR